MGARSKVQALALNVCSCARMWWHFPATAEMCWPTAFPSTVCTTHLPTFTGPLPVAIIIIITVCFPPLFSQFSSDAAAAAAAALDHWLSPSIHFLFYTFFLLVFYARGINGDGGGGGHCLHAIVAFFFLFFFVSRLLREGGVAQWNSRFLTIRITLPLFVISHLPAPYYVCAVDGGFSALLLLPQETLI